MEGQDFSSTAIDLLMLEGSLGLGMKDVVDKFIETSPIHELEENETRVVSKCCNLGFHFEDQITKNKRSKRSRITSLDNIIERLGFNKCLKRDAKKESSSIPSKKHKSNNINNVIINQLEYLPTTFKECIEKMEGCEVKLVIQKELTETDLNPNNGRFSIPRGKIQKKNFLKPSEESLLNVREGKNKKHLGMPMSMLGPNLKLYNNVRFKKWGMKTTDIYNITSEWNKLVKENLLQANNKVQLSSFRNRNNHQLYFALVKL